MPIVISRTGEGEPRVVGTITPEQKKLLWEQIVKNYAEEHKEALREALTKECAAPV